MHKSFYTRHWDIVRQTGALNHHFFAGGNQAQTKIAPIIDDPHGIRYSSPRFSTKNSPMQADHIRHLIEAGLNDCTAIVTGDDGVHFTATVISADFIGKTRIQAQKMVYATVTSHLQDGRLHALSLTTFTPTAWQEKNHG